MRKTPEASRRRRLLFDPLERRHLLSGGPDPTRGPVIAPPMAPEPQDAAWVLPMLGPDHGPRGQDGEDPDVNAADPGPGPGPTDAPGGDGSGDPSPPPMVSTAGTSPTSWSPPVTPTSPAAPPTGGSLGSGSGAATGTSLSVSPASTPGVGSPGGSSSFIPSESSLLLSFARAQNGPTGPSPLSESPLSSDPSASGRGGHGDGADFGSLLLAALNYGPSGPVGPGMASTAAPGPAATAVVGAAVAIPQAQQLGPNAGHASPHPIASDHGDAPPDHPPATAIGPVPRSPSREAAPTRGDRGPTAVDMGTSPVLADPGATATNVATAPTGPDREAPRPQGVDLIAEALPSPGESLERSLQELVHQLDSGDMAGLVGRGATSSLAASLTVAGATAASALVMRELARRRNARRGRLRAFDPRGRELALCFPELPRTWSARR